MKRSVLVILIALLCSTVCYGGERFAAFPTVGVCTGSNVRYRSQPSTNADI